MKENPADVLWQVVMYGWVCCRPQTPGAVVISRPKAVREVLAKLKPEHIANVRVDTFMEVKRSRTDA